ncbi:MAG: hypothetical protein M5U19_22990 [Microthrixaceae bacterium]|nr:hypothetical protein [Microthrixaceae bacterium]
MFSTARHVLITSVALAALVLPGCSDDDDEADDTAPSTSEAAAPTPPIRRLPQMTHQDRGARPHHRVVTRPRVATRPRARHPLSATSGCWVHLYDEDRFDERDPHFQLSEPGRYPDMAALPGAAEDWTDQADSIRVGPDATVTIWPQTDFRWPQPGTRARQRAP